MKKVGLLLAAALSVIAAPATLAQSYPSRPIKMIVPFGPGSGVDIVARIFSEGLAQQLKQTVVTENHDGAAGMIGINLVANQPADGYTVLAIPNTFLITPQLSRSVTLDPVRQFTALAKVASVPFVLATSAESRFKTMAELISYMRQNPGKASYATSGKGAQSQLEVEYINQTLGLKAVDVPYKASAITLSDTIAGVVDFYLTGYGSLAPNIRGGKLRALAVGAPARLSTMPNVPTFIEATGIANYVPTGWFGFVVRSGTPADAQARLEDAIVRTANTPAAFERLQATGNSMNIAGAREFNAEIAAEAEKWGKLITSLNLKSD